MTIRVKQVKGRIKRPKDQEGTFNALGLRKVNQIVEYKANSTILDVVEKAKHLVSAER